ncbi:MAG: hypothetical protein FWE01_02195, partial [Firmicutes bacterium]|nr:hypothetical protein [Bacillota bacterium]
MTTKLTPKEQKHFELIKDIGVPIGDEAEYKEFKSFLKSLDYFPVVDTEGKLNKSRLKNYYDASNTYITRKFLINPDEMSDVGLERIEKAMGTLRILKKLEEKTKTSSNELSDSEFRDLVENDKWWQENLEKGQRNFQITGYLARNNKVLSQTQLDEIYRNYKLKCTPEGKITYNDKYVTITKDKLLLELSQRVYYDADGKNPELGKDRYSNYDSLALEYVTLQSKLYFDVEEIEEIEKAFGLFGRDPKAFIYFDKRPLHPRSMPFASKTMSSPTAIQDFIALKQGIGSSTTISSTPPATPTQKIISTPPPSSPSSTISTSIPIPPSPSPTATSSSTSSRVTSPTFTGFPGGIQYKAFPLDQAIEKWKKRFETLRYLAYEKICNERNVDPKAASWIHEHIKKESGDVARQQLANEMPTQLENHLDGKDLEGNPYKVLLAGHTVKGRYLGEKTFQEIEDALGIEISPDEIGTNQSKFVATGMEWVNGRGWQNLKTQHVAPADLAPGVTRAPTPSLETADLNSNVTNWLKEFTIDVQKLSQFDKV